jgi:hypothetical protein
VPDAFFDHLGSPQHTLAIGISPQGDLVGCFIENGLTMTTMHGWLWRNGEFIKLATPRSSGDTTSHDPDTTNNGVSAPGGIAGFYLSCGVSYIADEAGIATRFTVDENLFTLASGINARGDVVGTYGTNLARRILGRRSARAALSGLKTVSFLGLDVQGASNTQVVRD